MFQLEEDIWFWLLLIPLGMLLLFLWTQLWKKRTKRKFSDLKLLKRLSPDQSLFKSVLKFITLSLGFICLIIALVNPKIGTSLQTVKREGVDIVFAIDVSKSMLAEDIAPNRLEKAKQLTTQIINTLVSDRVGIIAYAAKAVPQLPITTDYSAAKMFLQNMNTDMLSSQGTAIDEAIQLSRSYYNDEEQTNRVLVIISDGEDHNNLSLDVAEAAAKEGIKIFTIGVGTEKGGPIPIKRNGIVMSYKKDQNDATVITKLNKKTLSEIADEANGTYVDGKNTSDVIETVGEILNKMDKKEFEAKEFAEFKDQFQWFLGLGLFFLILDVLFLERKTAWLKRLNLFNENL
ncbi:MAG: VWA domain-containing protein [Bacteroidetes bacterium]|nr:VWA domain-containing protein [Bacteroidota bacterium]MDA0860252.1 VWA domain-containing protein [Bacteroidota bacterium]MDA1318460.1 VWA domain-containing protein [Bacteroidota bacterium]